LAFESGWKTEHADHPVIRRSSHQRSIAGILGVALLGYALLVPIADAKLITMVQGGTPATADEAPCHMANDEMSPAQGGGSSPCCQVDRCFCFMLSATVAMPGIEVAGPPPVRDLPQSIVRSLNPYTLVELPLRPPDA
jgi:hypothetical protein